MKTSSFARILRLNKQGDPCFVLDLLSVLHSWQEVAGEALG